MTNALTRAWKSYIWEPIKDAWAMAKENPLAVVISIFGAEFGIPPMWVPAVAAGANTAVKGGSPQDILKSALTAQAMAYIGRTAGGAVGEAAAKAGYTQTQAAIAAGAAAGGSAAIAGSLITGQPLSSKSIMSGLVLGGISAGIPKLMAPDEAASMVPKDVLEAAKNSSDPIGYINKAMDWTPGLGTTNAAYSALNNYDTTVAQEVAQQYIDNYANLGIDQSQIAGLESLGYDPTNIQDLINAGADATVITDAANLGIDATQLSSLTTTQFDPYDIVDMIENGHSIQDITAASDLVDQGKLSIENARTIVDQGYNTIDMAQFDNLDQVASLTDQGVSKYTIDTLNSHGYDLDQVESLIESGKLDIDKLNNSGANAGKVVYEAINPQYSGTPADQIARTGLVDPADAKILAANGYTASQVQSLVNAGYGATDLVDLASTGVPATTLQSLSNTQFSEYQINDMLQNRISANDIASASTLINTGKLDVSAATNLLDAGYNAVSLNRLATNGLTYQVSSLVDRGLTKNSIDTLVNNGWDLDKVSRAMSNGWTNASDINTNVAKAGYGKWLTTALQEPPPPPITTPIQPTIPTEPTFAEQNIDFVNQTKDSMKKLYGFTDAEFNAAEQANPYGNWVEDAIDKHFAQTNVQTPGTSTQPVQPITPIMPESTIPVAMGDGTIGHYDPSTGNVFNDNGQLITTQAQSNVTPGAPTDVAGPYRVDVSGQPATDRMTPLQRQEFLKGPIPEGTVLANNETPGAYYDVASNAWVVKSGPTEITQPITPEVIPEDTSIVPNITVPEAPIAPVPNETPPPQPAPPDNARIANNIASMTGIKTTQIPLVEQYLDQGYTQTQITNALRTNPAQWARILDNSRPQGTPTVPAAPTTPIVPETPITLPPVQEIPNAPTPTYPDIPTPTVPTTPGPVNVTPTPTPVVPSAPEVPTTPVPTVPTTPTTPTTPIVGPTGPIGQVDTGPTTPTGPTGPTTQPTGPTGPIGPTVPPIVTPTPEPPPLTPLPVVDVNPPPPVTPVEVIPPTPPIPEVVVEPEPEPTPIVPEVPVIPYIPPTPAPNNTGSYSLNWGTPPTVNIPTGLNPGWIAPTPFYQTTNPAQSQYYWGQHPYQPGPTFDATLYNTVPTAPTTPWGATKAQTAATYEDVLNAMYGQYPFTTGPIAPPK